VCVRVRGRVRGRVCVRVRVRVRVRMRVHVRVHVRARVCGACVCVCPGWRGWGHNTHPDCSCCSRAEQRAKVKLFKIRSVPCSHSLARWWHLRG
jgi:epoxyqueuosine reductase QueG